MVPGLGWVFLMILLMVGSLGMGGCPQRRRRGEQKPPSERRRHPRVISPASGPGCTRRDRQPTTPQGCTPRTGSGSPRFLAAMTAAAPICWVAVPHIRQPPRRQSERVGRSTSPSDLGELILVASSPRSYLLIASHRRHASTRHEPHLSCDSLSARAYPPHPQLCGPLSASSRPAGGDRRDSSSPTATFARQLLGQPVPARAPRQGQASVTSSTSHPRRRRRSTPRAHRGSPAGVPLVRAGPSPPGSADSISSGNTLHLLSTANAWVAVMTSSPRWSHSGQHARPHRDRSPVGDDVGDSHQFSPIRDPSPRPAVGAEPVLDCW